MAKELTTTEIDMELVCIRKLAKRHGLVFKSAEGMYSIESFRWVYYDPSNGHYYRIRWGMGNDCWIRAIRKYHKLYSDKLPPVVTGQGSYLKPYTPKIK